MISKTSVKNDVNCFKSDKRTKKLIPGFWRYDTLCENTVPIKTFNK